MSYPQLNTAKPVPGPRPIAATFYGHATSGAEWNRFRPLIKQLYIDEEKTLKEVMAIMERDHGHRATAKMYKDRIKKWNLDKKTKEEEAWALLRKKTQREAAGKKSAFRVRGKTVTADDVLRYFKRKGILDPETLPQPPGPPTPPAMECWTPVASPKQEFTSILELEERGAEWLGSWGAEPSGGLSSALDSTEGSGILRYLNVDQTQRILFSNPEIRSFEIPSSPLPPQSLLVPEKLFASIKTYFGGAFDGGLFKNDDEGDLVNSANETIKSGHPGEFYGLCASGIELMNSNSFVAGRRFFSKASSLINNILRSQHPRTLEYVFYSLLEIRSHGYNQVATLLRIHMRNIATLLFADGHPWSRLFSQIADIEESQFQFALIEAWRYINDIFTNSLGQFHRTALRSFIKFLSGGERPNAPQLLHDLLIRGEQELGIFDDRFVDIKFYYGVALYKHNQHAEAIEVLEEVVVLCKEFGSFESTLGNSLDLIVNCRHSLGLYEENDEFRLREAIERLDAIPGHLDSNVLFLKTTLWTWLCDLGREAEALEVQAEINEALGPYDIELDSN